VSRNSIQEVTYGYLERDIYKVHQNAEERRVEEFWLGHLEGKAPVKRVVGRQGDRLVLETSHGLPLLTAAAEMSGEELQEYVGRAAKAGNELYKAMNSGRLIMAGLWIPNTLEKELERQGIEYKLDKDAIGMRFDRFLQSAEGKLKDKVARVRDEVTESLIANATGMTHADFSPRNLMIEDDEILILDHENYRQGDPVSQVVSLVMYPYYFHNPDVSRYKLDCTLEHWAGRYNVAKDELQHQKLFWGIRQAGAIAGRPELAKFHNYFTQEVEKAL